MFRHADTLRFRLRFAHFRQYFFILLPLSPLLAVFSPSRLPDTLLPYDVAIMSFAIGLLLSSSCCLITCLLPADFLAAAD